MRIIELDSLEREELAPYAKLTEAQLRMAGGQAAGEEGGLFIAESLNVVESAIEAGYAPLSMLSVRRHIAAAGALLEKSGERFSETPVFTAPPELLEKLTGFRLSRGVLAAMRRRKLPSAEDAAAGKRRIAVLEGVVDATNIGAIFRSAAALGMEAVLVGSNCCDPLNRRALRVSMGTVFKVPWAVLGARADDPLAVDVDRLKALGFHTAALALRPDALSVDSPQLAQTDKLALLLGSEGDGLRERTILDCDHTVLIPMANGVDSLNVAAAAAVAFYQLGKKRWGSGEK